MPKREQNRVAIPIEEPPYTVTVHVDLFETGVAPRVSGITIEARESASVSPREVRRLPLSTYIERAVAVLTESIADPTSPRVVGRQRKGVEVLELEAGGRSNVSVPRGRPERGRSTEFYRELARAFQDLARDGVRPVPEIARRKRASENTVHQWIHRARKLGFLPESTRRRRR